MELAPSPERLDAAELVARIHGGDQSGEDELFQRYRRGVAVILHRATSDRSLVEDLCQETFRIALTKIRQGDVREPARLSGFISSLARNLVVDHFRRMGRLGNADAIESVEPLVSAAPGPLECLLRKERAAIVRRVLAELGSERDRQLLCRFYIAEDDKERICADLGLTSLQFNHVLFRARRRYRELYEHAAQKDGKAG